MLPKYSFDSITVTNAFIETILNLRPNNRNSFQATRRKRNNRKKYPTTTQLKLFDSTCIFCSELNIPQNWYWITNFLTCLSCPGNLSIQGTAAANSRHDRAKIARAKNRLLRKLCLTEQDKYVRYVHIRNRQTQTNFVFYTQPLCMLY